MKHIRFGIQLGLSLTILGASIACSLSDLSNLAKLTGDKTPTSSTSPTSSASPNSPASPASSSAPTTSASPSSAPSASGVIKVETKANETITVKGNFNDGKDMSDLSWAANSSVACFPATENAKFRAKHVMFSTSLPARSIMNIKVKPTNENTDLSVYAYSTSKDSPRIAPDLPSAVQCEYDAKWDRPKAGKPPQDSSRSISLNATTNPYTVVIGVTGPQESSGEFTLEIELKQ